MKYPFYSFFFRKKTLVIVDATSFCTKGYYYWILNSHLILVLILLIFSSYYIFHLRLIWYSFLNADKCKWTCFLFVCLSSSYPNQLDFSYFRFVRVEKLKENLLENNEKTYWVPDFVKVLYFMLNSSLKYLHFTLFEFWSSMMGKVAWGIVLCTV